jgi:hypothetical protein
MKSPRLTLSLSSISLEQNSLRILNPNKMSALVISTYTFTTFTSETSVTSGTSGSSVPYMLSLTSVTSVVSMISVTSVVSLISGLSELDWSSSTLFFNFFGTNLLAVMLSLKGLSNKSIGSTPPYPICAALGESGAESSICSLSSFNWST